MREPTAFHRLISNVCGASLRGRWAQRHAKVCFACQTIWGEKSGDTEQSLHRDGEGGRRAVEPKAGMGRGDAAGTAKGMGEPRSNNNQQEKKAI